ncbi:MAG: glutamate racemase [Lachnospiraceae bacterium]|nr:glutamate racemase [Lachnospiraceae bacterium]
MDKNSYIGVFDSGIGGLTVVKGIVDSLPDENIVYFGDTARVPYGTRSKRQIIEYALSDVKFLATFDIKAVVIACNTADSTAREEVMAAYPEFPVFGVVDPASRMAAKTTRNGRIGVMATKATAASGAYDRAIARYNPEAEVFDMPCSLLVPLVENGRFLPGDKVAEMVVQEYAQPLVDKEVDTLILGCTHFPLLTDILRKYYPELNIISSSGAAAQELRESLEKAGTLNDSGKPGTHRYFVSDDAAQAEEIARYFMGSVLDSRVEQVRIE